MDIPRNFHRRSYNKEVGTKYKTNIRETCEKSTGPARYNGQPAFVTALKTRHSHRSLRRISETWDRKGCMGPGHIRTREHHEWSWANRRRPSNNATNRSRKRGAIIGSLYAILGIAKD